MSVRVRGLVSPIVRLGRLTVVWVKDGICALVHSDVLDCIIEVAKVGLVESGPETVLQWAHAFEEEGNTESVDVVLVNPDVGSGLVQEGICTKSQYKFLSTDRVSLQSTPKRPGRPVPLVLVGL